MNRVAICIFVITTILGMSLGLCPIACAQGMAVVNVPVTGVYRSPDETSEMVTQALFNQHLRILQESRDWIRVSVPDQLRDWQEYRGWVPASQVTPVEKKLPDKGSWVVVSHPGTQFYYGLSRDSISHRVYFGTTLQYLGYREDTRRKYRGGPVYWLHCRTFDNQEGWIFYHHAQIRRGQPFEPSGNGDQLAGTASLFAGSPYLWGGMTSGGIDCSGLTYMVYRFWGFPIPRDADEQFLMGRSVGFSQLKPGDLLFFGRGSGVNHVGIYSGGGWMIHAGRTSGVVSESIHSQGLMRDFIGARRILD